MSEIEENIRRSVLDTLRFLSSETELRAFAEKVFYHSYHGEFACWCFDTFQQDDPNALTMFGSHDIEILKAFSQVFDQSITSIGSKVNGIEQLIACPEWKLVVASATDAHTKLHHAT